MSVKSPTGQPGGISPRAAVLALTVLTLINLVNYLDRYVVAAVTSDLKAPPMGLSDPQLGMLPSAFMLVYMLTAPVFGILGDRGSRTRPIAIGIFIWSLATVLSGLAQNYPQLLGARALVGIGEAAYIAIAPALLSDCFAREQRGRVLAIFNMAIPVGSALGYVIGGLISHHYGWRTAFYVAGAPGLVLALLALALPDPPRGAQDPLPDQTAPKTVTGSNTSKESRPPLAVYLSLLRRPPFMVVVLGYAAYTFAVGGLAFWMPEFLHRVRGVPQAQATTGFGAIVVVTGFLGTFIGGWLGDYWLRYSRQAYQWLSGVTALIAVPLAIVALTAPSPSVFYPAIIAAELFLFMSTGPINSALINLVAPTERASASALNMFLIHLLGDVFSPTLIGTASYYSSLGTAVLIVPAAIAVCGVLWLVSARVAATASPTAAHSGATA